MANHICINLNAPTFENYISEYDFLYSIEIHSRRTVVFVASWHAIWGKHYSKDLYLRTIMQIGCLLYLKFTYQSDIPSFNSMKLPPMAVSERTLRIYESSCSFES